MTKEKNKYLNPSELVKEKGINALDDLIVLLNSDMPRDIVRASEEVAKLSKKFKNETRIAIPFIIKMLDHNYKYIREYGLKALHEMDLEDVYLRKIEDVSLKDNADRNRNLANEILNKYKLNIGSKIEGDTEIENNSDLSMNTLKLKPRDKKMYLYKDQEMERYSANYSYTNHNFAILNNHGEKNYIDPYYPLYCILKNILMRGCPTRLSSYLQEKIGVSLNSSVLNEPYYLISKNTPNWINRIKGDIENNYYPAEIFFHEIIPKYLPEHKYIQQLILTEAPFSEIVLEDVKDFKNQQVDFYIHQAKLVIEIDGQSHQTEKTTKLNDKKRDMFLSKHGIETIRINTKDIKNRTGELEQKIDKIKARLQQFEDHFIDYKLAYENIDEELKDSDLSDKLLVTAIIRFQILILSLLEKGKLKLTDKTWKISVIERDVKDFERLAIDDLFIWIENLCKLHKLEFNRPRLFLNTSNPESPVFKKGYIDVDFSLFERWTDEHEIEGERNRIYVRTDYFDDYNYFIVSTDKLVEYKILPDGEDSDVPALKFFLKNIFGFDDFNDGQLISVIHALSGNDTIGLLPTGGGKSLIYQYVGLLQPCISFVVAPLISLMKDQRDGLDERHIFNTNYISSAQEPIEKDKIQSEYGSGKYQFLLISPERFQTKRFREELQTINHSHIIGIAVIDEVHCLSEWGHDFRTSYLNLAKSINKYAPNAIILGLTATASVNVLKDILVEFDMITDNVKTLPSFTRAELDFIIFRLQNKSGEKELIDLLSNLGKSKNIFKLNKGNTNSGLIFTRLVNNKNGCFSVAERIRKEFAIDARWYAGSIPKVIENSMKNKEFNQYKEKVQDDFINNKFPLLVATKAFGMGIDKSNIRYTIHYGIPGSLESLYQEAGRAGRDRKNAKCFIMFNDDNLTTDQYDILFNVKSDINLINKLNNEIFRSFKSKDVMGNIFLWLNGISDIDVESNDIYRLYTRYAESSAVSLVEGSKLNLNKDKLEKAIYKLSLLGIVDDWTIEVWSPRYPKIEVAFSEFNDDSIFESLLSYIKKYDKEYENYKDWQDGKSDLNKIFTDDNLPKVQRAIKMLLIWQYENIAYHRRQSIKTVYDQCRENYNNPIEFKKFMESYFKFNEFSFDLDYIAERPLEVENWFRLFYIDDDLMFIKSIDQIQEIKANLRRFLESYRYNTGLNYISGLLGLLTNDFNKQDGRERFELALIQINNLDENKRDLILVETLKLCEVLDNKDKLMLSEILNNNFTDKEIFIYEYLKDDYSAMLFLEKSVNKLKEIGVNTND